MASIACMVLIETDNPVLLYPEVALRTVEGTKALRQAVIDGLPGLTRVIHVMSEESARFMSMAHEHALKSSGLGDALRPPKDYVAPADRNH